MATTPGYVSNADLASRLSALVDRWNTRENQMIDLLSKESGTVTVTDGAGNNRTLPSFPQLQADVAVLTDALTGAAAEAQANAALSAQYRDTAATAATDALAAAETATDAAAAAAASEASAAASEAAAATAHTDATNAAASATAAANSATSAGTSASAAATAKTASETARDKSNAYANADIGTEVDPGLYSAKHWANQAQAAMTGTLVYMGTWDASTGSFPATPKKGHFYKVIGDGVIASTDYKIGDQIIYNGAAWDKIDNTDAIVSVAGKVGVVTLVAADIGGLGALATLNSVSWSTQVTGKPTTLGGYGITDAVASSAFTWANLGSKPTTLSGFGITDAVSAAAFTWANLGSKPTTLAGFGITDAFTADTAQTATATKTFSAGIIVGNVTVTSATDLSRHIMLHSAGYGFSITAASLNSVVAASGAHVSYVGTAEIARTTSTGLGATRLWQGDANAPNSYRALPRMFVTSTDPGAAAADGDLWIW